MNKNKRILIDCCYLNSPGGKTILVEILNKIKENNLASIFLILIDSRSEILKDDFKKISFRVISNNEYNRIEFYKKNKSSFHSILCLSNVPPPIKLNLKVYIYFHNYILLSTKNLGLNMINRITFYLKKKYILWLNNVSYKWIVQSDLMKKELSNKYKISKERIKIAPIFENLHNPVKEKSNSFIYPTTLSEHKNNFRLLKSFVLAAENSPNQIFNLKITIIRTKELEKVIKNAPKNLIVSFLGRISRDKMITEICNSKFLIYPSLTESFGLPLIEGSQLGCYVICSDLPYAHEVINPTLTFNPFSVNNISKIISKSLQNKKLNFTEIKIESSTQLILNEIINV